MRARGFLLCMSVLVVSLTGLGWAQEESARGEEEGPSIRDFSLPEYNEKMELVSKIEGDSARSLGGDKFDITNLRFEMYRNGKVDARVTSPSCTFHKRKNSGWSTGSIRIIRDDLVVTGEDYVFDGRKEQIRIQKNAKVVIRSVNIKIWGEGDE